jgi:hypothetical protein
MISRNGRLHRFSDWPIDDLSRRPGVYTIWKGDEFIYVGMAGRGVKAEDANDPQKVKKLKGLWGRLNQHASGKRSGDQFCVYVCDRFIVPALERPDLDLLAGGKLNLDERTGDYIRENYTFRLVEKPDDPSARALESEVRQGGLSVEPLLKPPPARPHQRRSKKRGSRS